MRPTNFKVKSNRSGEKQEYGALKHLTKAAITLRRIFTVLPCLFLFSTVFGQGAQYTENKADQTLRSSGRVNPSSLGMEIDIPLGSYPGRGINVPISLSYSSKLWRMEYVGNTPGGIITGGCRSLNNAIYGENSASGWTTSMTVPYVEYVGKDNLYNSQGFPLDDGLCDPNAPPTYYQNAYVRRLSIHLPGGETHELRADDTPVVYSPSSVCPPANGYSCDPNSYWLQTNWDRTFYAVDGSNIKYVEDSNSNTYRLLMPDGSYYDFTNTISSVNQATARKATKFTDRNGNYTTYNDQTGALTDTMGRTLSAPFGTSAPVSPTTQTYTMPGMTGSYKFQWRQLKGGTAVESALTDFSQELKYSGDKVRMTNNGNWESRPAGTFLFGSEWDQYVWSQSIFNPVVLTEIELPTGQKYKFTYDIYGRIERIYYPTGGEERFEYAQIQPMAFSEPGSVSDKTNFGVVNRKVYETAGQGTPYQWTYGTSYVTPSGYKVSITNPDGTKSERFLHMGNGSCGGCSNGNFGYDNGLAGMAYKELAFSSTGGLLTEKLTHWSIKSFPVNGGQTADWHPRVDQEDTIIYDASGNSVKSTTRYEFEGDLNLRETPVLVNKTSQYAFVATTASGGGAYAQIIDPNAEPDPNPTPVPTPVPPTLLRTTETTYLINDAVNYPDPNFRNAYKNQNMVGLPTIIAVKDSTGTVVARSKMEYDENGYSPNVGRSNVTSSKIWDSTKGSTTDPNAYLITRKKFDSYGNQIEITDPKGNVSSTEYSATYNYAYPTKITTPVPDPNGVYGSNAALVTTTSYDPITGVSLSITDANGQATQIEYDEILRPKKVTAPNGQQIITEYDNQQSRWTRVRTQIDNINWKEATTYSDGLGRPVKNELVDSKGNIFTETEYDAMGRVKRVTNPYRQGEQKLWNRIDYDEAGRNKESFAPAPDGQTGISLGTIQYSISTVPNCIGTVVITTDAAGKKKRSIKNAMDQLIRVDEATGSNDLGSISTPNQSTYYSYNTLGKMIKVQQGNQYRYFLHDSMGRLLRVRQPEQDVNPALNTTGNVDNNNWTAGFTYDNNGNAITATDAKNITITSAYDNVNRLKMISYSDATPQVSYFYDDPNVPFSKGKLTKVVNAISTSQTMAFDNIGRPLNYRQITDGQTYTSQYQYNLSGSLVQETYPSGRIVKNEINTDGKLLSITGQTSANSLVQTYANSFAYTSSGATERLKLGNGRWETAKFNNGLQVTELGLGNSGTDASLWKVNYDYGEIDVNGNLIAANNNGNIARQTVSFAGLAQPFIQTYKYDSVNRLTEAKETKTGQRTWQQNWSYDRFGNRLSHDKYIGDTQIYLDNKTNPTINPNTNRFNDGQNYQYDFDGNIIQDADGRQFTFNGDNKQTQVRDANNNIVGTYYYDGGGKRIKKVTDQETTIFVYSGGKLVAEYSTQISQTPRISYLTTDTLGSPRVITDQNGNVISRRDFMPFGEEIYAGIGGRDTATHKYSANDNVRQGFTGYEKDRETGLDFAEARYYNSNHGRFTAIDPLLASGKSANPQTFNRYVYVMNNPTNLTDPSGMLPVYYRTLANGDIEWSDADHSNGKGGWRRYRGGEQTFTATNGNRYIINRNGITNLGPPPTPRAVPSVVTPSMSAGPPDRTRPGLLFLEFLTGLGESERFFGQGSTMANELSASPDVAADTEDFCKTACVDSGAPPFTRGGGGRQFGLTGWRWFDSTILGQNGNDSHTRAVADNNETRAFVGSFQVTISELDKKSRLTMFTAKNSTGLWSFAYHILPDRQFNSSSIGNYGGYRDNWRPSGATIKQTFQWSVINPCGCK
jgi:RHS repeat-associated protein